MSIPLNIPTSAKPLYTWNARLFQSAFIQKGTALYKRIFSIHSQIELLYFLSLLNFFLSTRDKYPHMKFISFFQQATQRRYKLT